MNNSLKKCLEGFKDKFDNQKKEALKIIGSIAVHDFKDNFEDEGFDGKKWKTSQRKIEGTVWYEKATSAERESPTLTLTGNLKRSIKITKRNKSSVTISPSGNSKSYAWKHQFGDKNEGIPQRKFMGLTSYLKKKFKNAIANSLKNV
jgi:phage gpG-like protein